MLVVDLYEGDCLDQLNLIRDASVDMVVCDLPYGITECAWDSPIDLTRLWQHYRRVCKPLRVIVLTATQPFATTLIARNMEWFRYEWIWTKNRPTNFVHAKNQPMRKHENVLIFRSGVVAHAGRSARRMPYYPQGLVRIENPVQHERLPRAYSNTCFAHRPSHRRFVREFTNYPTTIVQFDSDESGQHETGKPVDMIAYFIRTYTEPGATILDNCMGSGTTGVAALQTGRRFIGMERDRKYFDLAYRRLKKTFDNLPQTDQNSFTATLEERIDETPFE